MTLTHLRQLKDYYQISFYSKIYKIFMFPSRTIFKKHLFNESASSLALALGKLFWKHWPELESLAIWPVRQRARRFTKISLCFSAFVFACDFCTISDGISIMSFQDTKCRDVSFAKSSKDGKLPGQYFTWVARWSFKKIFWPCDPCFICVVFLTLFLSVEASYGPLAPAIRGHALT